jgi:hypothetical protein
MTDYNAMIRQLFTAPARAMTAQPPKANLGGGLLEKLHNAVDPVQALGGYGNMAAMALPPGAKANPALRLPQLAKDAVDAGSFEAFRRGFGLQTKHGKYYHVTDNPNFQIDPARGPRDMSSMAGGKMTPGDLMITSDPELWAFNYGKKRPYIAEIDVSGVPYSELKQVGRGFGNEFYLSNASRAKVNNVRPTKNALAAYRRYHKSIPQSEEALRAFYKSVTGKAD